MTFVIPFVYYSGITGWNGYLFYLKNSTTVQIEGNLQEHELLFQANRDLRVAYSKGSGLLGLEVLFKNAKVVYFYPEDFYALMGGIFNRWGELFVGFTSDLKPSISLSFRTGWGSGGRGIKLKGMGKYYGGYEIPLDRKDAWGYHRYEIRNPVAYSITLIGHYRLMEQIIYAGFVPVGKRGLDLLIGVQYFDDRLSLGAGFRVFYPVVGSFYILAGMEPASRRWDMSVGVGEF